MALAAEQIEITCAVEVFVATALLHREQPDRSDFSIQEIVNRASRENLTGEMRSGVAVHASQHCVANREPNPARHRMLFATGKHNRRLLEPGDEVRPARTGKIFPEPSELPEEYQPLLAWAKKRYEDAAAKAGLPSNPGSARPGRAPQTRVRDLRVLIDLRLAGAHLANGEDPDDYVRRLREGWE